MSIEELMSISQALKGVTTDIKWEEHLCFNVGEKIFLLTAPDQVPPNASFKVSEEDFDMLTDYPEDGLLCPDSGKGKWVQGEEWVPLQFNPAPG